MRNLDHMWIENGASTVTGEEMHEAEGSPNTVEEALKGSFPASDPPPWTGVTGIGSHPPAPPTNASENLSQQSRRQAALAQQTRGEHDALLIAMHRLEAALAAAAPGREQAWNARVGQDLRGVQECLARHVASAEAADGLLAEIDLSRPTLARRAERLRREHAELLRQADALQSRIEHHGPDECPDFADIRQRAAWLLGALRHHQGQEADLIFETFYTDIGAGD